MELQLTLNNFPKLNRRGPITVSIDRGAELERIRDGLRKWEARQEQAAVARIKEKPDFPKEPPVSFTLQINDRAQAQSVMDALVSAETFTMQLREERDGRVGLIINWEEQ